MVLGFGNPRRERAVGLLVIGCFRTKLKVRRVLVTPVTQSDRTMTFYITFALVPQRQLIR
ncbi:hypothetical protein SAMN05414139_02096 [Burkholderia sp. D7]|nr:hypothetical protein SAMN05414139_02096 [Burkholderia sp. D7]